MRRSVLLLALGLAACGRAPPPAAAASPPPVAVNPDAGVRTYRCTDGTSVEAGYPDRQTAVVTVGGHAYTLKAATAASGVRYVGMGLQWWTKGLSEARLSRLKGEEAVASDPGVACRTGPAG